MRNKYVLTISAMLFGACIAVPASAIDLDKVLGAGKKAGKAMTLSDQEVVASANEACQYMDQENPVAASNDKYAVRLAKITQGLQNEDGLNLNFKVYKTPEINAWAMANGCVRVYSGMMDAATDDEIRGVIGHEIGHVKLGHTKSKMRTALLASAGRDGLAASGSKASAIAQGKIGDVAETVLNAQFSQKEESAADEYGYRFMVKHKYDPNAMVTMFKKVPSQGGMTSSHPGSEARASKIEKLIKQG